MLVRDRHALIVCSILITGGHHALEFLSLLSCTCTDLDTGGSY